MIGQQEASYQLELLRNAIKNLLIFSKHQLELYVTTQECLKLELVSMDLVCMYLCIHVITLVTGRIGRLVCRAALAKGIRVVAVNDLMDVDYMV